MSQRNKRHRSAASTSDSRELLKLLTRQRRTILAVYAQTGEPLQGALQRFADAIALADTLRREKQLLLEVIQEREHTQHRVLHITSEYENFVSHNERVGRCQHPHPHPRYSFRPLTIQDCRSLTSAYYSRIRRLMEAQASARTCPKVFGWSDSTQVSGSCINFFMQKTMTGYTASELSNRSWQMMFSAAGYNNLFSAAVTSSVECLQVVDPHNIVVHERTQVGEMGQSVHALSLLSRVEVEHGFVEIMQPLDRSRLPIVGADPAGEWVNTQAWVVYQTCPGDENVVFITTGGTYNVTSAGDTSFWAMEMQQLSMRWENAVVGPRFSLTNE